MNERISLEGLRAAEDFDAQFEEKTTELIVLVSTDMDRHHTVFERDKHYMPFVRFHSAVNVETGELLEGFSTLIWKVKRNKLFGQKYGCRFKAGNIYRVLARRCLQKETKEPSEERGAGSFYLLVKVLEKNVQDSRLKPKTGVAENSHLSNFLEEEIDYLGRTCPVVLDAELGKTTADLPLGKLKEIVSDLRKWDEEVRKYAAAELAGLANEWRDESKEEPVTEEQFAKRIEAGYIHIYADGSVKVGFSDDNMFGDHGIVVYIDKTGKTERADIEG